MTGDKVLLFSVGPDFIHIEALVSKDDSFPVKYLNPFAGCITAQADMLSTKQSLRTL